MYSEYEVGHQTNPFAAEAGETDETAKSLGLKG